MSIDQQNSANYPAGGIFAGTAVASGLMPNKPLFSADLVRELCGRYLPYVYTYIGPPVGRTPCMIMLQGK